MNCSACDVELPPVDAGVATDYQYDNALWVGFFGGYSMFVDNIDAPQSVLPGSDYAAVLCHDCAHGLCERNPWIAALLQPERSHSHTKEFWKENPDHDGWDKEMQ